MGLMFAAGCLRELVCLQNFMGAGSAIIPGFKQRSLQSESFAFAKSVLF